MKLKKVSKNIALGEPIMDVRDLERLALEQKSVVWDLGFDNYYVRPASLFLSWPLRSVLSARLHYTIKI